MSLLVPTTLAPRPRPARPLVSRGLPGLTGLLVAGLLTACGLPLASPGAGADAHHASTRVEPAASGSSTTITTTTTPARTWSLSPSQLQDAAAALATLPVKGRAPKTGYSRAAFGIAWSDDVDVALGHNGCDTRNDILRRDLTAVRLKPGTHGCVVLAGALADPYTARTITFARGRATSSRVQIDHVVALGDAWVKGAQQLTATQRAALANDPLNLLAVDGPTNSSKRDADAASWLPPNQAFRCAYVARQVAVKQRYHLWVTAAERAQIARVLAGCRH
ncbi:hypothetical protein GCM10009868_34120 [Terrabacter aerolatus]|uniref:GmrSD restriction endonucleases C-terminal domain-containing protein n=1 Tax=Terrabacter aerolatus TaxID=422442 RepID=A0A512CWL4_9MICO|nr:HNH endonuclease family protein [Terrabacter aerolatus]GEO28603.1 hypothetical protein TAE01_04130 [Terrabacter aerolatus]